MPNLLGSGFVLVAENVVIGGVVIPSSFRRGNEGRLATAGDLTLLAEGEASKDSQSEPADERKPLDNGRSLAGAAPAFKAVFECVVEVGVRVGVWVLAPLLSEENTSQAYLATETSG